MPLLREVGLQPHELGVRVLEERLVYVVPAVALYEDVVECRHVASLGECHLPADGVPERLRAVVDVGIAYLRDKAVLDRGQQVEVLVHDFVELFRLRVDALVLHRQWRELMGALLRRLPAVGPLAAGDVHAVVLRTDNDVRRQLGQRRWRREEAASRPAVLSPAYLVAIVERRQDAWELQRDVATVLVVVHPLAAAELPFVVAVQVDVEVLAAVEGVVLRETHLHLRAVAPDGAPVEVGLVVEVVGLVQGAGHLHVEGVVVAGRELEVDAREDACAVQL